MADTTNKMILLFSMETFESLMDQVDELFMMTQSDPQTLSQVYLDQIRENPYSRWFAYDVVCNHLRYYGEYQKYNVLLLDNRRGARWAFYPAVMAIIDQLVADGHIGIVPFGSYQDDPLWINSQAIGIVSEYDHETEYLDLREDGDSKLEYLDLRVRKSNNVEIPRISIRLMNRLYPLLAHIHLQFECEMDAAVILSGPMIKYLSVDNGPSPKYYDDVNILLIVNDSVQLDYLSARWYNKVMPSIHRRGEVCYLEKLINRHMRYIDIRTTSITLTEIAHRLFESPEDVEQNPQEWPQLAHLGFKYLSKTFKFTQSCTGRNYTLAAIKDYMRFLPQLTSLDVPLMNSHASSVNTLTDQLVSLGLNYVSISTDNIALPTRLKHIRTLDLSLTTLRPNMKIGRWNLPKTCTLVSMYCIYAILEFNNNFPLETFTNLKYLMSRYFNNIEGSWLSDALSRDVVTSIVNYPASRSAILSPPNGQVIWEYPICSVDLSLKELMELFKEVQPQNNYNTNVFLKRLILEDYKDILTE